MTQCTRFPVLTHILVCLAVLREENLSSAMLARSVDTNPAVIRRLLALLVAAGWVETQAGARGGARLTADPKRISLRDVYQLAEHDSAVSVHRAQKRCPIAKSVKSWLSRVCSDADSAYEQELAKTTIADISADAAHDFSAWLSAQRGA